MRLASGKNNALEQGAVEESKPVAPKRAVMLAKIFGDIPVACPKCGTIMDLKEFVFDKTIILKFFPYITRSPPKLKLEDYIQHHDAAYTYDAHIDQTRTEIDDDFNQEISW